MSGPSAMTEALTVQIYAKRVTHKDTDAIALTQIILHALAVTTDHDQKLAARKGHVRLVADGATRMFADRRMGSVRPDFEQFLP